MSEVIPEQHRRSCGFQTRSFWSKTRHLQKSSSMVLENSTEKPGFSRDGVGKGLTHAAPSPHPILASFPGVQDCESTFSVLGQRSTLETPNRGLKNGEHLSLQVPALKRIRNPDACNCIRSVRHSLRLRFQGWRK